VLTSGKSPAPGVTTSAAGRAESSTGAWWKRPLFGVGIPLIVGLVHVALVAPHYFVGSFDDDANYILTAKALLAGKGLSGHVTSGAVVAGLYPPGYSALIAPLVWLWPHSFLPLRLLSTVCYALVFVLTWIYLGQRRIGEGIRVTTLGLLALGPTFATFGSMVMAEAPFLVALLVLLILVDRWDLESRLWTRNGLAVVLLSGALVWLKEAGIGVVAGLVLWLLLKPQGPNRVNRIKRPLAVGLGVATLLMPVVVARLSAGIPLTGSRYSTELGGYYQGNLIHRVLHVLPHSGWHLLVTAIPATLIPYLSPLPIAGSDVDVWQALSVLATLVILLGAVVWYRRYRDAALAIVPVYLLETVFWPEVNERRVILVLPVLAAWWAVGAVEVWRAIRAWSTRHGRRPAARVAAVVLVLAIVVVPLAEQMPRDYLFKLGQTSSQPQGSRYADMLSRLGVPSDVVETDYLSTMALFTEVRDRGGQRLLRRRGGRQQARGSRQPVPLRLPVEEPRFCGPPADDEPGQCDRLGTGRSRDRPSRPDRSDRWGQRSGLWLQWISGRPMGLGRAEGCGPGERGRGPVERWGHHRRRGTAAPARRHLGGCGEGGRTGGRR
jgi:hypothetical protein